MTPCYIVFQNEEQDFTSAVVCVGNITHAQLWTFLKRQRPQLFAHPLSAGVTWFNAKTKKFVATDSSPSLNLIPHESDRDVLQEVLTNNTTLKLAVCDFGHAPDFSFLLGASDVLKEEYFSSSRIYGWDRAEFRLHDSRKPFKFGVSGLPTQHVFPPYIDYVESRLVA